MRTSEDSVEGASRDTVVQYGADGPLHNQGKVETEVEGRGGLCYRLTITSRRKRLIDPDNLYCKGAIDALKGVIIEDDSARHIQSLTIRQEKIAKGEQPETIIEIEIGRW